MLETFSDIKRSDIEIALSYWTNQLSKQTGIPASTHIYRDIQQMKLDFESEKINFIILSPLAIIENFNIKHLSDGYKAYSNNSSTEDLLVISRKDSGINNAKDFKNKKLSLLNNEYTSELFINTLSIKHLNQSAKKTFKQIKRSNKSLQLIYNLFFKQTDVILVYKNAYQLAIDLNPQIKARTQIIHTLPKMHRGLGFFHSKEDEAFKQHTLSMLENIHTSIKGRQVLSIFLAEKLKRSSPADLNNIIKLKKEYNRLTNNNTAEEELYQ